MEFRAPNWIRDVKVSIEPDSCLMTSCKGQPYFLTLYCWWQDTKVNVIRALDHENDNKSIIELLIYLPWFYQKTYRLHSNHIILNEIVYGLFNIKLYKFNVTRYEIGNIFIIQEWENNIINAATNNWEYKSKLNNRWQIPEYWRMHLFCHQNENILF